MNEPARKGTGATPRRKFDETYKRHAVELTLHGDRTVIAVAKELELPPWQLYEWRKLYAPRPGAAEHLVVIGAVISEVGKGPSPNVLLECEILVIQRGKSCRLFRADALEFAAR